MIQAVIASAILCFIYRFMKTGNQYEVDWWMAFVFVFVPVLLILLLSIALGVLNLPQEFALLGYFFYLLFPFLFLRVSLRFKASTALKYSAWVPVAAIMAEIPFVLLMGLPSA